MRAVLGASVSERAAPVSTQVAVVLARKARITCRNPLAGLLTVLMPCLMGTMLGSVFQGIGDKMFLQQVWGWIGGQGRLRLC